MDSPIELVLYYSLVVSVIGFPRNIDECMYYVFSFATRQ